MARLTAPSKIVDSDSDSDLPEMSTIFSAKSIATPRKNLVPRASSVARDQESSILSGKKPRRRVLTKARDNVLLRPLGRDSPAPEFEGRKKVVGGRKTLFDEDDEKPRARMGASRPEIALRRKIIDIAKEEEVEDSEEEAESSYVRRRVIKRVPAPRTVQQASAKEQAVKPKSKPTQDIMGDLDFGNLTIQAQSDTEDEPVVKERPARSARPVGKVAAPKYVEPESSEPEQFEDSEEEGEQPQSVAPEFKVENYPSPTPNERTRSIPMVIIPTYESSSSEMMDSGREEEEVDILEASCVKDDVEPRREPKPSPIPARSEERRVGKECPV